MTIRPANNAGHALSRLVRYLSFVLLAAFLLAATVRTNGLDYDAYLAEFLDPVNNLSSSEVGYVTLIRVIGQFTGFWLVLLIANVVFLLAHRPIFRKARTPVQCAALIGYLAYVGLFLVYGSPRRLIAYSVIVFIIQRIVDDPAEVKRRKLAYFAMLVGATAFHLSALIFVPVLLAYTFGRSLYDSPLKIVAIALGATAALGSLYAVGALDFIVLKLYYYAFQASAEQEYLADVPSVTSGLSKRAVTFVLVWLAARRTTGPSRTIFVLCLVEAVTYGALGTLSPVLAVAATYFGVAYLLPVLVVRRPGEVVSRRSLLFLAAAVAYYLPTSIGLIRQFGEKYV